MRLALDTNRYTDLRRGLAPVVELVSRADEIGVPLPVVAELRAGFANGTRRASEVHAGSGYLSQSPLLVPSAAQTVLVKLSLADGKVLELALPR